MGYAKFSSVDAWQCKSVFHTLRIVVRWLISCKRLASGLRGCVCRKLFRKKRRRQFLGKVSPCQQSLKDRHSFSTQCRDLIVAHSPGGSKTASAVSVKDEQGRCSGSD